MDMGVGAVKEVAADGISSSSFEGSSMASINLGLNLGAGLVQRLAKGVARLGFGVEA